MHVFISHSRVNGSSANRLCDELRKRGVDTWMDVRDLEPGAKWDQAVTSATKSASGFVFVIGPPGPGDRWQTFEWQQVVDQEFYLDPATPLIPVLIGDPEVPGFLRTRKSFVLGDAPESCSQVASEIIGVLENPGTSVDEKKLALGRDARESALKSFREYSKALGEVETKQAGLRAIK